jgi:protein SCO1/2
MARATELLEERGVEATPVFITIDPERDTPERLAEWVSALHPRMVGLTGSAGEIAAAADAYKAYYEKAEAPESGAGYLMNHSAFIYLMTPEGPAALFRQGVEPAAVADTVTRVLRDGALG